MIDACLCPAWDEWVLDAPGIRTVCLYGRHTGGVERDDVLVCTDEEGGDVTRLHYREGSPAPGNLALGVVDDVELTRRVAGAIASELAAARIGWNLAPVADVNSDPENPVIGVRSFGSDSERVSRHVSAFVLGTQAHGVAATAKHFPGHGATRADSHHELPVSETYDLAPFAAAVEAGVQAVMTAHVQFPELDDVPATLSRRALSLLRDELAFDGVIVTDALEMRALRSIPEAAVRALAAGADLLLIGERNGEEACAQIRAAVSAALRAGELTTARVEEAAERVERLVAWTSPHAGGEPLARPGLDAARRALRVEGDLPLSEPPYVVELRAETNPAVGEAHWSLAEELAELGFLAGTGEGRPLVVAFRDERHRDEIRRLRPDVVVSLGMAEGRGLAPAFVEAYGAGRANTQAAAEALCGPSRK